MPVALTKGLNHKCCDCGIALKKEEIAYEVTGSYIDYIDHIPGQFNGLFCSGCRERILHNFQSDQGDAILKRKEIEKDGPGPLKPLVFPDTEIDDFRTPDGAGVGM
jgi:hypothetical protein